MADLSLTRRYATALYDIAVKRGQLARVAEDVELLNQAVSGSPQLLEMLKSPEVTVDRKKTVLQAIFGSRMDPLTLRFFGLLVDKRRTALLEHLHQEFQRMADKAAGIVRARVETAVPLLPEQELRLRQQLSQLTGKNVLITSSVDPALQGGVVVWLGDRVIDGSVRGYLASLEQRLVS